MILFSLLSILFAPGSIPTLATGMPTCLLHIQKLALKTFNYYAGNVPAFNEPRIKKRRTHEMSTSVLEFRDLGIS